MGEFDIAKYERFLDKNPNLHTNEHWARAKKTTYTLFNLLIDSDLRELVFVLERYPDYIPLVCEHFRYSYSYSEHEANIEAASKLLFMGEEYKTKQFMRNVVMKLPKIEYDSTNSALALLERVISQKEALHPAILFHYKNGFERWLGRCGAHPLQQIAIKKSSRKSR